MATTPKTNGSGKATQAFNAAVQAHRQVQAAQEAVRAAKETEHKAVIAFMTIAGTKNEDTGLYSYKNPKSGNSWVKYGDEKFMPQHRKLGKGGAGAPRAFLRVPGGQEAGELED